MELIGEHKGKCQKCHSICNRVLYIVEEDMDLCCLCDGADPCKLCKKKET